MHQRVLVRQPARVSSVVSAQTLCLRRGLVSATTGNHARSKACSASQTSHRQSVCPRRYSSNITRCSRSRTPEGYQATRNHASARCRCSCGRLLRAQGLDSNIIVWVSRSRCLLDLCQNDRLRVPQRPNRQALVPVPRTASRPALAAVVPQPRSVQALARLRRAVAMPLHLPRAYPPALAQGAQRLRAPRRPVPPRTCRLHPKMVVRMRQHPP